MLAGAVTPADLPEAFAAKLREYLGVEPADVVDGVLQDVHWSDSNFGYFPTYALGNVIAVAALGAGDGRARRPRRRSSSAASSPLCASGCGEHVHRWGRVFEPAELLERVVGGPLDAGAVPRLPPREGRGARSA